MLVLVVAIGLLGAGRAVCRPCAVEAGLMTAQLEALGS
jgi:hypothetical protein